MVYGEELQLETRGFSDIHDLTRRINGVIGASGMDSGLAGISVIGSTASITSIEFEPALVEDMKAKLEELVSRRWASRHSETWGDDNGFSHVRASLMGPGVCLPFRESALILGTWQQIVVVDHDNRSRTRRIYVQLVGEPGAK